MDCRETAERLTDYVLGLLADDERVAVEAHLASGCAACANERREVATAASALAETVDPVAASASLRSNLLRAIAEPVAPAPAALKGRTRHAVGWGVYLAASLAAIVAGGAAGWLWRLETSGVEAADAWRRQIASAEEVLGGGNARLVAADDASAGADLVSNLLYDAVSSQLHVQIASPSLPESGAEAWAVLVDRAGAVIAAERLRPLSEHNASAVLNVEEEAVTDAELVVTLRRPQGDRLDADGELFRLGIRRQ
jgi:anti-sigma factor RsiW